MTPAAHAAAAFWIMSCAALAFAMISCAPPPPVPPVNPANLRFLDQGPNWTQSTRSDFYSRDQGSRIMPLRWMQALKQPKGDPFMADSLLRTATSRTAKSPECQSASPPPVRAAARSLA